MKRSLILLLAVALLATMVPTIALAADSVNVDKFTFAMPLIQGYVSRTKDDHQVVVHWAANNQLTFTTVTPADKHDSSELKVVWETSDKNIVGFNYDESKAQGLDVYKLTTDAKDLADHSYIIQTLDKTGRTNFPVLDGRDIGTATITGKIYLKDADLELSPTVLATNTFTVKCDPIWEDKVTLTDLRDGKEKEAYTLTYWITGNKTELVNYEGKVKGVEQIPFFGYNLEKLAHVHNDPDDEKDNIWASTYGVSDLVWSSTDESIAKYDKHAGLWFTGKTGTVTIRATAKGPRDDGKASKYAEITFTIAETKSPLTPGADAFKKVEFTVDELGVKRDCSKDWVNIARFLELDPRPETWYQGSKEHSDVTDGNYGVGDNIVWSSSNENLIWICRDPQHYSNGVGPTWKECYVEVSRDAKPGDSVIITATSKNNPELSDTIRVILSVDDTQTVSFERSAVTVRVGESMAVKAFGSWQADRYTTLTSLNADIATARFGTDWLGNSTVEITGVEPGTTTVTLESARHNFKATIAVTVVTGEGVKSVTVPDRYQNITMQLYDVDSRPEVIEGMNTVEVNVNVAPANAWYTATWTSSDPSVAYIVYESNENVNPIGANGAWIRAAGVGSCVITVVVDDGEKTFTRTMNVTVVKADEKPATPVSLKLNKRTAVVYLQKGADNTVQLTAIDKNTKEAVPVTWTSSDKKIATVNKNGLVKAKADGKVTITATTKDGESSKTCTLTVKKLAVTKVKPAHKAITMKVADTANLNVTVKPAKAYNKALKYKSSNSKVVSVDKDGNVVALKAGKAIITITSKDGSQKTATVAITVIGSVADNDEAIALNAEDLAIELAPIEGIEIEGLEDIEVIDDGLTIE